MSGKVQSKEEIKLNANEWRILSLIDGTRTVRQIITESGYDEFAVYKIFFSVISSGLIEQKEEVQFDDSEDRDDYSAVLIVFNDILATIRKNIADELGDRTYSIFEEVKSDLAVEFRQIFENYHPENHKNANLQAVSQAIANAGDDMEMFEDPKEFLVAGFAQYCEKVLEKVGKILGSHPLASILADIEKVLEYVQKYQAGSKEKSKIVNDMKNVINRIQSEFKTSRKRKPKGGIFSLFS
jgi:hypothetical protein